MGRNLLVENGTTFVAAGTLALRGVLFDPFIRSKGRLDHKNPEREDNQ